MDQFDIYFAKALRFLAMRPRSEKELRDSLTAKKIKPKFIAKIVEILKEKKFLDDEKFAAWWVEQRTQFRPIGKRLLRLELLRKGIKDDIISSVTQIKNSELEVAVDLVKKRLLRYKGLKEKDIVLKLQRFLLSRGFSFDTIAAAIDDAMATDV